MFKLAYYIPVLISCQNTDYCLGIFAIEEKKFKNKVRGLNLYLGLS